MTFRRRALLWIAIPFLSACGTVSGVSGDAHDAALDAPSDAIDALSIPSDVSDEARDDDSDAGAMDVVRDVTAIDAPHDGAVSDVHVPYDGGPFPAACDRAHPTFIGGHVNGSDNRAVNVLIGVDHSIGGVKVDADGVPCATAGSHCCAGYSWCAGVNPTLGPDGSTDPGWQRTFGRCVDARITEVYFELYPKDTSGHTILVRYGGAAHQHQPVSPGHALDVGLRIPLLQSLGGNTGAVNGYITCNGRSVPVASVTRMRAWSTGIGPDCGIEGFAASADMLGQGTTGTYYRFSALEGGRCNAPSQGYRLYVDVTCNGRTQTQTRIVDVAAGARPRVDWGF